MKILRFDFQPGKFIWKSEGCCLPQLPGLCGTCPAICNSLAALLLTYTKTAWAESPTTCLPSNRWLDLTSDELLLALVGPGQLWVLALSSAVSSMGLGCLAPRMEEEKEDLK